MKPSLEGWRRGVLRLRDRLGKTSTEGDAPVKRIVALGQTRGAIASLEKLSGMFDARAANQAYVELHDLCESCLYFTTTADSDIGWCHRHAPTLGRRGSDDGVWPVVLAEEFCGDHKARTARGAHQ